MNTVSSTPSAQEQPALDGVPVSTKSVSVILRPGSASYDPGSKCRVVAAS